MPQPGQVLALPALLDQFSDALPRAPNAAMRNVIATLATMASYEAMPTVALLGDSITDNGFLAQAPGAGGKQYMQNIGFAAWLRVLTFQRVNIPMSADLGVGGNTLAQIADRVGSVLAMSPRPSWCIVQGGTNSISGGDTLANMKALAKYIIATLQGSGIIPLMLPITPRTVAGITTAKNLILCAYNNWLREYCHATPGVAFVDVTNLMSDWTNAAGDPLANYTFDGLHPTALGAYWMAKPIADFFNATLPAYETKLMHPQDYYDAVNNPGGNLLHTAAVNDGLLAGTAGTNTAIGNFTPSGNVATNWISTRAAGGTSTSTGVATKENPRTDTNTPQGNVGNVPNSGERQQLVYAVTVAGGADEVFQFRRATMTIGGANDMQPGDTIVGECSIEVAAGQTKVTCIELICSEFGGATGDIAADLGKHANSTVLTGAAWRGVLRTPPITLQSDSASLTFAIQTHMDTSAGTGGVTIKLGDMSLRKVQAL